MGPHCAGPTTTDPEKQKQEQSGGVTVDIRRPRCTPRFIPSANAPKQKGLIWVGNDDGNFPAQRGTAARLD